MRRFHADQRDALRRERTVRTRPGVTAWRRWLPLERVGAYVPGGRAPLAELRRHGRRPGAARRRRRGDPGHAAAVGTGRVVAGDPRRGADRVGVDRVLRVGGAQAIAALAYGTASVPRVDRIVGAGNAWVTAAKRAVAAEVAIDLPAGPSEAVVLADARADPELVALDLLAQAEHGPDSIAVLVTDAPSLVVAVEACLPGLAADLSTGDTALETLRQHGGAVLVVILDDALEVADAVAPEHVSLQCADADVLADRVRQRRRGLHRPVVGDRRRRLRHRHEPRASNRGSRARLRRRSGSRRSDAGSSSSASSLTGPWAWLETVDVLAAAEGLAGARPLRQGSRRPRDGARSGTRRPDRRSCDCRSRSSPTRRSRRTRTWPRQSASASTASPGST